MRCLIIASLMLCGCTTSYKHISDPRVSNDGYDLVCGGVEKDQFGLRFNADVCRNLASKEGEMLSLSITKNWSKK